MRAAFSEVHATMRRGGVDVAYELYDGDGPTVMMVPPSPITHSRIYKGQIPYLSRHFRVITMDGRGSGRSGRPSGVEAHTRRENVADIVAVLDATQTDEAILLAHCHANWWAIELAGTCAERVSGLISISPGVPYLGSPQPHWQKAAETWDAEVPDAEGWELFNRHVVTREHRRWIEFFFAAPLIEPHSTKQYEDAVGWAMESTGEILADSEEGQEIEPPSREGFLAAIGALDVPVLVIHGDGDVCQDVSKGRQLAEITGGDLVELSGSGHLALARDPVGINHAIKKFIDHIEEPRMQTRNWTRGLNRRKKVLYLSSPIGLGHARRDVAIAQHLRRIDPDLQIDWLAQHPVTRVLHEAGEAIHPASEWLVSESDHIVSESTGHDLHCFQALRNMDEILLANFMVFQEVVEDGMYDLVVGDEAWDVDHFWHENPELKRGSHVWMTDFVGFLPMPDGGDREAHLTADYNAEMLSHIARYPRIRDRSIFVGNVDDIYPDVFGPDLPKIGDWTQEHFDFSGYITGFNPPTPSEAEELRSELGFGPDEKVCVVTVGGSGVGRDLLEKVIAAYPMAKEQVPELRMIAVAGPRIDPESLPSREGLEICGYVDRLYRHLSVCDLAVVQGGLTTTMELTAANRPFLYFPLHNHFEQNYHVRYRLDQYGAGRAMDFRTTDPDGLAAAMATEVNRKVSYRPVETDGAERAARMIAELI